MSEHAAPLRAVLGAELEVIFAAPGSDDAWRCSRRGFSLVNGGMPLGSPSDPAAVRAEMIETYRSLTPKSDKEAETQARWLAHANGELTPGDIVNFRTYAATSSPTLTNATHPVGTPYSKITRNKGDLEFRGPGIYQRGWYDNPGVSEMRITPTPEGRFKRRRRGVIATIGATAAREGQLAFVASQHTNGSIFRGEVPLLGDPGQDYEPYLRVAAGFRALFLEGALLNPHAYPNYRSRLRMGPWRDSDVRMSPGRAEFRGTQELDGPDHDQAADFVVASLKYGVEHISPGERDSIFTATILKATPQQGFTKETDLYIKRAIEGCVVTDTGDFQIHTGTGDVDGAFSALLGREVRASYNLYCKFFTEAVRLGADGFLQTDEGRISALLAHPSVKGHARDPGVLSNSDIPAINAKLRLLRVALMTVVAHAVAGVRKEDALAGLRSAKAMPLVAPAAYRQLLADFAHVA